jgi:hypothetical protein
MRKAETLKKEIDLLPYPMLGEVDRLIKELKNALKHQKNRHRFFHSLLHTPLMTICLATWQNNMTIIFMECLKSEANRIS